MVMKDKLTKTGRSTMFYKARRFFVFTLLFASLTIGVSATTYISIYEASKTKLKETTIAHTDADDSKTTPLTYIGQ